MRLNPCVFVICGAWLLIGCGGDEPAPNPPSTTDDTSATTKPTDSPSTTTPSASSNYEPFFLETMRGYVSGASAFPEQPDGLNAFLADLFVRKDGSYVLFYAEGSGEVTGTGHSLAIPRDREFRVEGKWHVEEDMLHLGDIMRCHDLTYNDSPALYCELRKAIGVQAAVGRRATLHQIKDGSTPDSSSWADYK